MTGAQLGQILTQYMPSLGLGPLAARFQDASSAWTAASAVHLEAIIQAIHRYLSQSSAPQLPSHVPKAWNQDIQAAKGGNADDWRSYFPWTRIEAAMVVLGWYAGIPAPAPSSPYGQALPPASPPPVLSSPPALAGLAVRDEITDWDTLPDAEPGSGLPTWEELNQRKGRG